MKQLYIIILLVITSTTVTANELDSLLRLVQQTLYSNPGEGRRLLDELNQKAIDVNDTYHQTYVKAKLVEIYYGQFDTDSIYAVAKEAEEFARKHKEYKFLFTIMQTLAQRYGDQGEYASAIRKGREMYEEAKSLENTLFMARASVAIAKVYESMKIWNKALEYYNEGLQLLNQTGEKYSYMYIDIYINLITVYMSMEDYNMTKNYVDSLQIKIDEFIASGKKMDLATYQFLVYYFYGYIATSQHNAEEAHTYLLKAEEKWQNQWPPVYRIYLENLYSRYYWLIGNHAQSTKYIKAIIDFFEQNGLEDSSYDYIYSYADDLFSSAHYKEAAESAIKAFKLLERGSKRDLYHQINELSTLYEIDKIELQAQKDKIALQSARNTLIGVAIIALLLIVIATVTVINMRRMRTKNIRLVKQIRELDRLAAKISEPTSTTIDDKQIIQTSEAENELLNHLKTLMQKEKRYTDPNISRKALADALSTNETYLRNAIKEGFGFTFSEYIAELRLTYAKELLMESSEQYTIEAIAIDSGFGSRSTMYRQFRNKYGLSPDEFRRINQELAL